MVEYEKARPKQLSSRRKAATYFFGTCMISGIPLRRSISIRRLSRLTQTAILLSIVSPFSMRVRGRKTPFCFSSQKLLKRSLEAQVRIITLASFI
jgi:hypothetical protein